MLGGATPSKLPAVQTEQCQTLAQLNQRLLGFRGLNAVRGGAQCCERKALLRPPAVLQCTRLYSAVNSTDA